MPTGALAISPAGRRHPVLVALALFALAVVVRLLFLHAFTDRDFPFSVFYYGDSRLYREFALAILGGQSFDQGIPFHPPALAYLLAAVIDMVGERATALRAVVAILASSAVPLTYLLGRSLWNPAIGLGGALLSVFSFGLIVLAVSPNAEALYIPLLLLQCLLIVQLGDAWARHRARQTWMLAAASGLVLGLGCLTRAEHLGFLLLLPVALVMRSPRGSMRDAAKAILLMLAVAALVIAPWTARNARELKRYNAAHPSAPRPLPEFVLISNYGALNFGMANHEGADGTFRPDVVIAKTQAALDLTDPRQLDWYLSGYAKGLDFWIHSPVDAMQLALRKIRLASGALALGFGAGDLPAGLTGTRRPVDLFVPDAALWMIPLLGLAAWGAFAHGGIGGRRSILGLVMAHKLVTVVAFFGYARLAGHLLPFLFLLVSAAVATVTLRAPAKRLATFAAAIACAALLVQLAIYASNPRRLTVSGSVDGATGTIIQDAEVHLTQAPL